MLESLQPYIKPIAINVGYSASFLIIGVIISRVIAGNITKKMLRNNPTPSTKKMARIIYKMITTGSFAALFFMSISIVGINISLLMGGLGLAIGYAMEEVLGNIFASVMLVTHHRYHVGDMVKVGGDINILGTIESVSTRFTTIKTFDRQRIMIPNLSMIRSPITPYSRTQLAKCTGSISIPRSIDINIARNLITQTINQNKATTANEYTTVLLSDYSEGGSLIKYYHYFNPSNELGLGRFKYISTVNEAIHSIFKQNNINVPYPRRLLETSKL